MQRNLLESLYDTTNANAANDRELREMLRINTDRSWGDGAKEVSTNERTSKAEKSKQLFAMLW